MYARLLIITLAVAFSGFILFVIVTANQGSCEVCSVIKGIPYGDKAGHAGLYGMLVFLIAWALPTRRCRWTYLPLYRTTVVLATLITLEELSQAWFPDRTCDMGDLAASFLGIILGDVAAKRLRSESSAGAWY